MNTLSTTDASVNPEVTEGLLQQYLSHLQHIMLIGPYHGGIATLWLSKRWLARYHGTAAEWIDRSVENHLITPDVRTPRGPIYHTDAVVLATMAVPVINVTRGHA